MSHSTNRPSSSRKPAAGAKSLREQMSQDLQLRGMAKRTHDGYLREVRKLACYYHLPPDQLSEQQVGDYLLHLINDCQFAPGSLRVAYSGLKFFYTFTAPRQWQVLNKLRLPKQKTLPAVLTIQEVHRLTRRAKNGPGVRLRNRREMRQESCLQLSSEPADRHPRSDWFTLRL